jgi:hypothetical protein
MTKRRAKVVNDLSRSLVPLDMDTTLIAVVEMSQSSWLVGGIVPGVERQPLKKLATDPNGLLKLLLQWRSESERKGSQDRTHHGSLRSRPRRLLAGAMARRAGHRPARHPCFERSPDARASPRQDRPARHGDAQACVPRLAPRRAGPLQDGGCADTGRGGCQASEPGARGAGRRGDPADGPSQSGVRAARHSQLQPEAQGGAGASGSAADAIGRADPSQRLGGTEARRGAPPVCEGANPRDRDGAPGADAHACIMVWVNATHRIQGCGATPAPDSGAPLEHHLDRPLVRAWWTS